jgi:hypothetical protein
MAELDDNIVERGPCVIIEYAVRSDGSRPAKDSLDKLKKRDYERYSRFKMLFKQYAQAGHLPPSKFDDYEESVIKKFKHSSVYPWRVACFIHGNSVILTHAFKKKGTADIQRQIKIAEGIRAEHLARKQRR